MFLGPNVPHAYLAGLCLELMKQFTQNDSAKKSAVKSDEGTVETSNVNKKYQPRNYYMWTYRLRLVREILI